MKRIQSNAQAKCPGTKPNEETHPQIGTAPWSGASFQNMVKPHKMMIAKYPHGLLGKGAPFGGIENLRSESKKAVEDFTSRPPE